MNLFRAMAGSAETSSHSPLPFPAVLYVGGLQVVETRTKQNKKPFLCLV